MCLSHQPTVCSSERPCGALIDSAHMEVGDTQTHQPLMSIDASNFPWRRAMWVILRKKTKFHEVVIMNWALVGE